MVVGVTISSGDAVCAKGRLVAVLVPKSMMPKKENAHGIED